jgi:hypothetical protein
MSQFLQSHKVGKFISQELTEVANRNPSSYHIPGLAEKSTTDLTL